MQAKPSKFQFMFLKHFRGKDDVPDSIEIDSVTITCQSDVKLLGMIIDDKLRFNKHVDILCTSAARQLNVMYRFKNIFDMKEKEKDILLPLYHENRMYTRTYFKAYVQCSRSVANRFQGNGSHLGS